MPFGNSITFFNGTNATNNCGGGDYNTLVYSSMGDMVTSGSNLAYRKFMFIVRASNFSSYPGGRRTVSGITLRGFSGESFPIFTTYFQILLQNTSATNVGSGPTNITGATFNYDAGSAGMLSSNETFYPFTTNFTWDGSSNIYVVLFCKGAAIGTSAGLGITSTTIGPNNWGFREDLTEATGRSSGPLVGGSTEVFCKLKFIC